VAVQLSPPPSRLSRTTPSVALPTSDTIDSLIEAVTTVNVTCRSRSMRRTSPTTHSIWTSSLPSPAPRRSEGCSSPVPSEHQHLHPHQVSSKLNKLQNLSKSLCSWTFHQSSSYTSRIRRTGR
jgi:hypothetical protein